MQRSPIVVHHEDFVIRNGETRCRIPFGFIFSRSYLRYQMAFPCELQNIAGRIPEIEKPVFAIFNRAKSFRRSRVAARRNPCLLKAQSRVKRETFRGVRIENVDESVSRYCYAERIARAGTRS